MNCSRSLLLISPLLFSLNLTAQNTFTMADGSGTGCQGVLYDTGGQGANGYQNNEDLVFTLCPDIPGNVIYLTFFNFNLDQTGPNPIDNLSIYDGDSQSATTLGTYTGTDLQNIIVSGTVFNTTGCLTLVFHSNGNGTGVFAAGFQCTTPCEHPTAAAVMSETTPALICQGEELTFDGSASFPVPGFTIVQYLWDFDDGTQDSTSGAVVSHVFDDDGEHLVQLYITDDNDCGSLNLVDLQVLVGTTPTLISSDQEICFGETASLVGEIDPITWTGIPDATFGDGVYLPDDVGQPFTSELLFEQFEPGATVTSTTNIQEICVDMEHSFMGDLVLQVICPNGQTVIFHQQGGGGTYIGGANDTDNDINPIVGDCWHYCWSPTATNGTWVDNIGNTVIAGNPPGNALIEGTYESVQPFSNLIGCPLNGLWTFQSTDLWAIDNGFICSWEINFDPSLIPDVTTFTPVYGLDCDSSFWSGPNITGTFNGCDSIVVTPPAPGSYDYTYTVTDNFGCTYDTTFTLVVTPPFTVNAGLDQVICSDPVQLFATANGAPPNLTWEWTPPDGLSNTAIPNPTALVTSQTTYTATAWPTGHPLCAASDDVVVTLDPGLDPGLDTLVIICMSAPSFQLIDMLGGTPAAGGVWTNSQGQVVTGTFNPMTDAEDVFTYTVTTALGCVGTADLTIQLLPLNDPACCGIVDAGPDDISCNLSYTLNATIANAGDGIWSGPPGFTFNDPLDPQATVTAPTGGSYQLFWNEDDGNTCQLVDSVTIIFTVPMQIATTTVPATCYTYCDGTASTQVSGGNIGGNGYTFTWSNNAATATDPNAINLCAGSYTVEAADSNACSASTTYTIDQPVLLEIDSVTIVDAWCYGACDGSLTIHDAEAVQYSFNGGGGFGASNLRDGLCAGSYDLAIQNAAGCLGTTTVTVGQPPEVIAEFVHQPIPANIDAPTIYFYNESENAVAYLWDIGGLLTTQEENPWFTFSNKEPGTYRVCLVATDAHGCTDTICHDVVIDNVLYTYIPNTFTPDGDGLNDLFFMTHNMEDIRNFEFQVFDRWGEVVFETNDYNQSWNGTFRNGGGEILKEGIYAWRYRFQLKSTGGWRDQMGHVSLLK